MKPFIVSIEGIDGSGKQTATGELKNMLETINITVTTQDFPRYGTPIVDDIVKQVLKSSVIPVPFDVALHNGGLFAQDRADWARTILPAITTNIVILDRFIASNLAYQMSTVSPEESNKIKQALYDVEMIKHGIQPNLTVLLDVDPIEALRRRRMRQTAEQDDAYESNVELQNKVFSNYKKLRDSTWITTSDTGIMFNNILSKYREYVRYNN